MNSKRKIEINIVEIQTYKILIQINSILEKKVFKNVCNIRLELLNYQNIKLNLIRNCDL